MTDIDTLAARIRAGLDADEQILMAVSTGPHFPEKWTAVERAYSTVRPWHVDGQYSNVASGMCRGDAAHVERHDPHRVLAEVAVKRRLLDLLLAEKHGPVWSDPGRRFYHCASEAQDPCDCGRDARVAAYLAVLAESYEETAG